MATPCPKRSVYSSAPCPEQPPDSEQSAAWMSADPEVQCLTVSDQNQGEMFISVPRMAARLMKCVQDYLCDQL